MADTKELADAIGHAITLMAKEVIPEAIDEAMSRYVHELRRKDVRNYQDLCDEMNSKILSLQRENDALRKALAKFGDDPADEPQIVHVKDDGVWLHFGAAAVHIDKVIESVPPLAAENIRAWVAEVSA